MRVLDLHWVQKLVSYDRIHVGFSGGLDSTVLLHALACETQLIHKIHAVHINHGLSSQAQVWQAHCQQECARLTIPCQTLTISFNRQANIEEEARHARYQSFSQLVKANQCLLTAHHQDDQAETVLLHLFRGAGVKGLSGISETMVFSQGHLHRPLLAVSRETLLAYALAHQLTWIEDESNADLHFSRNFVRLQVLPLLQTKWPSVSKNLVRTSELCRQAQANLDDLAELDCASLRTLQNTSFIDNGRRNDNQSTERECNVLSVKELMHLSESRLFNVLRCWLKKNLVNMPNYDTLRRLFSEAILADSDANPQVQWGNWVIKRFHDRLFLYEVDQTSQVNKVAWVDFPSSLVVPSIGILSAQLAQPGIKIFPDDQIEIRFRQGGETFFWRGQTKSLKKLMQEWAIPPWLRSKVPLIYVNQQLAAVLGYAISDLFYGNEPSWSYEIWDINHGDFCQ